MSITILIVEDERIVGFNLQQRLVKLGYEVPQVAVNSEQALHAIERHKPDIVLMDIHIEGAVDGIETAAIANQKYHVPVIYLTAYSEDATLNRARATRPYGFLLKPFSERELHATIQMALERYQVELALSTSEARLRMALSSANMADWELQQINCNGEVLYAGQADFLFGHTEQTFCGSRADFMQLVAPKDRDKVNQILDNCILGNIPCDVEFRTAIPINQPRWLRLQGKIQTDQPRHRQLIGVIQNITERKQAEQSLQEAASVFRSIQDGILILDKEVRIISSNESYTHMTGFSLAEVKHQRPTFFDLDNISLDVYRGLEQVRQNGGHWRGEVTIAKKDGSGFPALVAIAAVKNSLDMNSHFVSVITDLTPLRNVERKLQYLAHHDPLTDLPNRLLTIERLEQALLRGKRRNQRVAVLFIDLDNFKWVNDSLGHDAGDLLLKTVATRMKDCLRDEDTIGRLGGDEFLIILDPISGEEGLATVVEKLSESVTAPLSIAEHTIEISCSIGVSLFPEDGAKSEILIKAADTAMYSAKAKGRNCYEFFTPSMMDKAVRFLTMNHDLHRSLDDEELSLYYQPQISLSSKKLLGVEALVRWRHPTRGWLGPADVIPVAEDSGLIIEVGRWVLGEACRQLRRWQDSGLPSLCMAVNVSSIQLLKSPFVESVKTVLMETGIKPESLEIEITESVLQSGESCIAQLESLRQLGVQIAIDDFGTGYSSLSSLKFLPISKLKIDRAFVKDIPYDANDVAIAEVIIAFAQKLNMRVLAEGVETQAQLDFLRDRGCDEVQGFFFHQPLPAEDITRLLELQALPALTE